jgi:nucleoside-diphosphate-sugar epimerase
MKLLVIGGTRFVGRAVVDEALARGHDVTAVSRGESGPPSPGVQWVRRDRADIDAMASIASTDWDAVIDTWSGDPAAVQRSAIALADAAGWYGYVSSRSVYRWPLPRGADESAPVVSPDDNEGGYPASKRAAELAVTEHFPHSSLLARAGLILGPHEDAGRLTWWLSRAALGGRLFAPAPHEQIWQYIDARDLAVFLLDGATAHTSGTYNVVCPRSSGVTTERLLLACLEATGSRTAVEWVPPEILERAGVREWDDLPGWVTPDGENAGLHDCDVSAAVAAGLSCRSIEHTAADTWSWLREIPPSRRPPRRPDLPRRGLSAEQEQAIGWLMG